VAELHALIAVDQIRDFVNSPRRVDSHSKTAFAVCSQGGVFSTAKPTKKRNRTNKS
jgi:hypothetical protein